MAGKSLLDIEAARQRLGQLDQERQELSTLIQKLKHIRDIMISLAETTEANKKETDKWLKIIETEASDTGQKARQAIESFSKELENFRKEADALLVRNSQLPDQVLGQMIDLGEELREAIEAKSSDLGSRFAAFREEHFGRLDEVSKTYERMRISYDNTKNSIRTLEDVSERFHTEYTQHLQKMNNSLQDIGGVIDELDLFAENLATEVKALRESADLTTTEARKLVADTDRRFDATQRSLQTLVEEIQENTRSASRSFRVLRLGMILALLLGSIAFLLLVFR